LLVNKRNIKRVHKNKMAANVNKLIDHDDFDYNRTVEELACLDSLAKVSRYGFNLKNT